MKTPIRMAVLAAAVLCGNAFAVIPTVLTDKIRSGSGIIDIFKDAGSAELSSYLNSQGGTVFLGVDLNEEASGIESSTSSGVAIREMELIIRTTNGSFSFTDFYTNTTAMIREQGATEAREFHTLFGHTGSSQITGGTTGFNLGSFDDVIELRNVSVTGTIIGAQLRVQFVTTAAKAGANENFFDYSAGFEEFAILTAGDAGLLEAADIGLGAAAPTTVTFTKTTTVTPPPPAGTPEPMWLALLALPGILLWRRRGEDHKARGG